MKILLIAGMILSSAAATAAHAEPTPVGILASCPATTLNQAVECLRTHLSEEDRVALVADIPPGAARGRVDKLVQLEFRLADQEPKLRQWFEKRGIRSLILQSAVVIDSYLAQRRGQTLNLGAIAKLSPGTTDGPAPTAADIAAIDQLPPGQRLSLDECARRTRIAVNELVWCVAEGDRLTINRNTQAGD